LKRPAFQFYPGDWRNNAKLRRCSWEARGVWIECMGLMHDSDEYGILRWPLREIAQALGAPMKVLKELVIKGVLYGCEKGDCESMVFTPKHGRRLGKPVVLVEAQPGPIWFSPRMVRDEYVRLKRGSGTRFGDDFDGAPMGGFGDDFDTSPNEVTHHREGDGPSSSSSSSSSEIGNTSTSTETEDGATPEQRALGEVCRVLRSMGMVDVHPGREELRTALADGIGLDALRHTAAELAGTGPPPKLNYLLSTVRGRIADAARSPASGTSGRRKHSANEPIKGRNYAGTGTPIEQLDPSLRAAVERELAGPAG
jgi:hypothetical protein